MENKNVLVIGGAGAIGINLVRELATNNKVHVIDNFSSGRLQDLEAIDCRVSNIDIRDVEKLNKLFIEKIDIVVHLAAHFANQNSVDFPVVDATVNILGTLNVLKCCRKSGSRFVYASSSCVYGNYNPPFHEEMKIDDLHTPYAISKYTGELYTKYFIKHYGLEGVILRFFNSFGPYDYPGLYRNVIPNFFERAINNLDLNITGTGQETRAFNYCSNTVSAIVNSCVVPYDTMPDDPVFNIGTGEETKLIDLAGKIISLTSSDSKIIFKERRDWDHANRRSAKISKAEKYLSYKPTVSLDEGLRKTSAWFKSIKEG